MAEKLVQTPKFTERAAISSQGLNVPSMYEIYDRHATEYDRLVSAEDYQGNLARHLLDLADWRGRSILEAGTGTGRLTRIYAESAASITCLDRSVHMLETAARHLERYRHKIHFLQADNLSLPRMDSKADIFLEGWSWGHSIVDQPEPVHVVCNRLFDGVRRNLASDGMIIIIETMGTNVTKPRPPHPRLAEFYQLLEEAYSFKSAVIRTDYSFKTVEDAAKTMGFFFGTEMEQDITQNRITVIPEWTGVWNRKGLKS
jgi:SAM-dependent methyltransferase